MVNNKPKCFYAYITRKKDNTFIGEVNIHWNYDKKWYEMGIVLESKYRGSGYSVEALKKLIQVAFEEYNAPAVHNDFEITREAAIAIHKAVGFNIINEVNGIAELLVSKHDYFNNKPTNFNL
jgi:RimJ/RimL family protein N-acetyltransferase